MESVPHVLLKASHIHLRRRARGKRNFVSLSGLTENSPRILQSIIVIWLFSNSKTALYMYNVFKYQVPKLQFL